MTQRLNVKSPDLVLPSGQVIAYRVRYPARSRRIKLWVNPAGVQVTAPPRAHPADVRRFIESQAVWIQDQLAQRERKLELPTQIHLQAVARQWSVSYYPESSGPLQVRAEGDDLGLWGSGSPETLRQALRGWLLQQGRDHLVPWLQQLAALQGITCGRISIRNQRSRWGSCSRSARFSLNCKLLLIPRELVRFVLHHELCHTRQPNHGRAFHQLLSSMEPNARALNRQLRGAWQTIPGWAHA